MFFCGLFSKPSSLAVEITRINQDNKQQARGMVSSYLVYPSRHSYAFDYWKYTTGYFSKTVPSPHCIQLLRMTLSWDVSKRHLSHLRIMLILLNAVFQRMRISIIGTIVLTSSSLDLANRPWTTPAKLILSSILVRDPPHGKL